MHSTVVRYKDNNNNSTEAADKDTFKDPCLTERNDWISTFMWLWSGGRVGMCDLYITVKPVYNDHLMR